MALKPASDGPPSGAIQQWSGTTGDVPKGWTLCDGTDGAPDLRDRFVAAAGNAYVANDTGGQDEVQLSEDELPNHFHYFQNEDFVTTNSGSSNGVSTSGSGGNINRTDPVGSDNAHENRPPYYALAFIMKT